MPARDLPVNGAMVPTTGGPLTIAVLDQFRALRLRVRRNCHADSINDWHRNIMTKFNELDPQVRAELEAAMGDLSVESMLGGVRPSRGAEPRATAGGTPAGGRRPASGSRVHGTIVSFNNEDVFVEIGPKVQGVAPRLQFAEEPVKGESVEFNVVRFDKEDQLYILSRVGSIQKAEWESLQVGQVVEARCTAVNKGGLEMDVANHKAFMPAGQVDVRYTASLEPFVGQTMPCEVIEINKEKARIILSRRSVIERERARLAEEQWTKLEVGQDVQGVVRKIMPFGVFVDLGGLEGLIHISDLSYERVKDPAQVVKEGDGVTVRILKIDKESNRIGLGLKQREADPFVATVAQLKEGDEVSGRVTRIAQFGAFVELGPGVEGLVHISELSNKRVNRVEHAVKVDEIVRAKVLTVDPGTRRISLSIKALLEQAEADAPPAPRPGDAGLARLRAKWGADGPKLKGGIG